MATRYWQGDATAVAEVKSYTPTAANNAIYTLTINGNAISYTADASATVAEITAGLVAAWNASTIPEVAELTATDMTTYVKLTNDTAGVPFTVTPSTSGGGALVEATITSGTGPNYWTEAINWGGAVPTHGDSVSLSNSTISILYGLDQGSVALVNAQIDSTYTGQIGLPFINASGYAEYRQTMLKLNTSGTLRFGAGQGQGCGRAKIEMQQTTAPSIEVYGTGSRVDQNVPSLLLSGGGTGGGSLTVYDGDVGIWSDTATSSSMITTNVSGGTLALGNYLQGAANCTTLNVSGGNVSINSTVVPTTIKTSGGSVDITNPAATITTLQVDSGTVTYYGTGTVSTLKVSGGGSMLFAADYRARTVTNCTVYAGYQLRDPSKSVTWTNGIVHQNCGLSNSLDLGQGTTLVVS